MDRKSLKKAVILGLVLHIVIVAVYIMTRNTRDLAFVETNFPEQLKNYLARDNHQLSYNKKDVKNLVDFGPEDNAETNPSGDFYKSLSRAINGNGNHEDSDEKHGVTEGSELKMKYSLVDNAEGNQSENAEIVRPQQSDRSLLSSSLSTPSSSPSSSSSSSSSSSLLSSSSSQSSSSRLSSSPSSSSSVLSGEEKAQRMATLENPGKSLKDENHPLFNRAFSKNVKPAYLIGWRPSPESPKYFHKVEGSGAYLYSAFLEMCTPEYVRLIGISPRNNGNMGTVFCHYYDANLAWLETQRGKLRGLKDSHLLNQTSAAADCPVTSGLHPHYVTVTKINQQHVKPTVNSLLRVETHPEKPSRNFTLCFSPLHSLYNSTFQLVQSIELNRLFGASHFYFYNFSTTPQTDQILRYYQREGIATVLPWPLPHLESWYYGQIAAINDCIYRNKMTSRYVVIVDTDEFIVPNYHTNWYDLLHDVTSFTHLRDTIEKDRTTDGYKNCAVLEDIGRNEKQNSHNSEAPHFGSFMFRCSFFADKSLRLTEENLIKETGLKPTKEQRDFFKTYYSEPMLFMKRNDEIYAHEARSKLIVRPDTIVSHAIHKAAEHVAGYGTAYVNMSVAFLHHYRPFKMKSLNTLDMTVLKFKDQFYEKLKSVVERFPSIFRKHPYPS